MQSQRLTLSPENPVLASPLLPALFAGLVVSTPEQGSQNNTDHHRLKILDVGPALPETLKFFSQTRSRLYFADLFEEQLQLTYISLSQNSEQDSEQGAVNADFPTLRAYPSEERFDLCLFWDFLNYLNPERLLAFSAALQPFIHRDTRAHAFTTQSTKTPITNLSYGIESYELLSERLRKDPALELHTHSLAELKRYLPCLSVTRSRLLTDGRLEVLMDAHGA